MTTSFIARLRSRDEGAWFELLETFGPVLEAQLAKWGGGRIGQETVRDLSQETMAALSDSIDRYDPSKGARFSTWLLAIAKHTLGDEMDRRMALKRGGGKRGASLDEAWMSEAGGKSPDGMYEEAVFQAKVCRAIKLASEEAAFEDFSVFQMRVLDGMSGKEVAEAVGVSEPTVSRRLAKVRDLLRATLQDVIRMYSFTDEEMEEAERKGIALTPNKADDGLFDEAIGEIFRRDLVARGEL